MITRRDAPPASGEPKPPASTEAVDAPPRALVVRTIEIDETLRKALQTNVSRRRFAGK